MTRIFLTMSAVALSCAFFTPVHAAAVGNVFTDDFSDSDLAATGTTDTNWWTSSSSAGIEIDTGGASPQLGLVTGTSGRGLHTVFPTQTLGVGQTLKATYTFTTPAQVVFGTGIPATSFRVGLFDSLGRAGLDANVDASSGTPNNLYGWGTGVMDTNGNAGAGDPSLPGYMLAHDVNKGTGAADTPPMTATNDNELHILGHNTPNATTGTGRLMATTSQFTSLGSGGANFAFAPSTTYTGTFSVEKINATEVEVTGMIGGSSFSTIDTFDSDAFGVLAFHVNGAIFGPNDTAGTADNGINFSEIKVDIVPEPSALALALGLGLGLLACVKRRRK